MEFAIARRSLNKSIHQLTNISFDLAEIREYLIPFNEQPPTLHSTSLSTVSEESSYAEDSPGSLIEYTVNCNGTNAIEETSTSPFAFSIYQWPPNHLLQNSSPFLASVSIPQDSQSKHRQATCTFTPKLHTRFKPFPPQIFPTSRFQKKQPKVQLVAGVKLLDHATQIG